MKKRITMLLILVLAVALLAGCGCKHEWQEADCNDPKLCVKCGETEGEELGHDYVDADCENPRICSRCGKEKGEALGHSWVEADCENPRTCSVCGKTEGEALGHNAGEATCEEDGVCAACGAVITEALGHSWVEADCENPKTCSRCGVTEGQPNGHSWLDATYEAPKTCSVCGKTEGEPLTPAAADLGLSETELISNMNSNLYPFGHYLRYVGEDADGVQVYELLALDTDLSSDVFGLVYLENDVVYGVIFLTENALDEATSTLVGNCFGVAAYLVDNSFSSADLQAMVAAPQISEDGTMITYEYEKNGITYAMVVSETQLITAIAPTE